MVKDNTHYSRTRPMTEVWEKEAGRLQKSTTIITSSIKANIRAYLKINYKSCFFKF